MIRQIQFPEYSGLRCLMMPYIQGHSESVPEAYAAYRDVIESVFIERGDIGFLTIDESIAIEGKPHRGARSRHGRALHTEAGKILNFYCWGGDSYVWGGDDEPDDEPKGTGTPRVTLNKDVRILLANTLDGSCAIWNRWHEDTSFDGDIGHVGNEYRYAEAILMRAGDVHEIGILTPHESLPVSVNFQRQFLRIVSSGVNGRAAHFTDNPLLAWSR